MSADDLMRDLGDRIGELAEVLTGTAPTSRTGNELRFGTRGSLSVKLAGPKAGSWFDHSAGVGGDALGLVAHIRQCPMRDAAAWARTWLGTDVPTAPRVLRVVPEPAERTVSPTVDLARRLWFEGVSPQYTAVEVYLMTRRIDLPAGDVIRFHPCAWRNRKYGPPGPAMLGLMTDPITAEPSGLHVTYLAADGHAKASGDRLKVMLGHAGVIRLVADERVTTELAIGEGIETTLAAAQRYGLSAAWAATSAGGIARLPILPGIETLIIFADSDDGGAGKQAARTCAEQWSEAGRSVTIAAAPAGEDFADVAVRKAA